MPSIKGIVHEVASARYDLSFSDLTIHVHLREEVYQAIRRIVNARVPADRCPEAQYSRHPQVAAWSTMPKEAPGTFGYGNVCACEQEQEGWVVCSVPLARSKNPINEAATLSEIFDLIWVSELLKQPKQFRSPHQQLVTVHIMAVNVDNRSHMAGLQILFSAQMLNWIMSEELAEEGEAAVLQAMEDAYIHMAQAFYDEETAQHLAEEDCRFYLLGDRRPNFEVPGNACDLAPDGMDMVGAGLGCELTPHNVDTHIQQLTLLAGVAKLCELARRSLSATAQ